MKDKDDEAEFERTKKATSIPRPHGRVDIAIDFSSQIYGFGGHKTSEPVIYDCEKYSIWSDLPSIPIDVNKLHEKTNFYNTRHIYINYSNNTQTYLLEDEAYKWFMSPDRLLSDFESKDFLEQIFIAHTIRRLQEHIIAPEPWKDLLREYHSEDRRLLDRFLTILEPKILGVAKYLYNYWGKIIDYGDISSRAFIFVQAIAFGDNKKVIEDVLEKYNHDSAFTKTAFKKLKRDMRVHPFSTHTKSKKTDIKKTFNENIEYLLKLIKEKSHINSPIVETLLLLLLERDHKSSWLTGSLNINSERIYSLNNNISIVKFIFGKYGYSRSNIVRYLKDSFRTEKSREKNLSSLNDEFEYKDIPARAQRWKKNDIAQYTNIELNLLKAQGEKILKGKSLTAYMSFLDGSFDFSDPTQRQRLSRARKIIKEKSPDLHF